MSTRTRLGLIALVWAVAAILCVLPSVWPWYDHLIGTRTFQAYENKVVGFVLGGVTVYIMTRRTHR